MIIGISGKAQSGKDTVCKMIQYCTYFYNFCLDEDDKFGIQHYEFCQKNKVGVTNFKKHAFAAKLKAIASVLTNANVIAFEDINFKNDYSYVRDVNSNNEKAKLTHRQLLQYIGDKMREIDPDIWVKGLLNSYYKFENWIIPDLRFKNEAKGIRETDTNSLLIRVENPRVKLMNHKSEIDLDDYTEWDYIINNDGTLEQLLFKVQDILINEKIIKE